MGLALSTTPSLTPTDSYNLPASPQSLRVAVLLVTSLIPLTQFGDEYEAYRRRTSRRLPGFYQLPRALGPAFLP